MVEVKEAEAGLGKTAVVEGESFVVVGVPAFDEEKIVARVVLQAQKYVDKVMVCDDRSVCVAAEIAGCKRICSFFYGG